MSEAANRSGPRISVIVPVYNGARFVAETLRSALEQTLPPAEVITVDDGSTDASAAVARSVAGVRVIAQPNQGAAEARNTGLRESSGEWVVFLDHDDLLRRDALEIGAAALAAHPDAGFVYGRSQGIDASGAPLPTPLQHTDEASYWSFLEGDSTVPPATVMFRRAAVLEVGGWRKAAGLTEDHDLYLRVARRYPIHCHNRVVADYRMHDTNLCYGNIDRLLRSMLWTLDQQVAPPGEEARLEASLRAGRRHWRGVFGPLLATQVLAKAKAGRVGSALSDAALLLRQYPQGYARIAADVLAKLRRVAGAR